MMNNVIEAPTISEESLASPESGERTLLLLLASREVRNIRARAQEDAAIEAEDILTQAEEALAL